MSVYPRPMRRAQTMSVASALAVATLLLSGPPLRAQAATPICEVLSDTTAVTVIGEVKQKRAIGPDACAWQGADRTLSVARIGNQPPEAIKGILQVPKQRATPGDAVQDEAGIGDAAVSEIPKAGGRVALMVASGSTMWTFAVDHVYRSGDVGGTLPQLKNAAKEALAKK